MLPCLHMIRGEAINQNLMKLTFETPADREEIHSIHRVNWSFNAHERAYYVRYPYLYIEKPYIRRALDAYERQLPLPFFEEAFETAEPGLTASRLSAMEGG